jgi:hypothetical protein
LTGTATLIAFAVSVLNGVVGGSHAEVFEWIWLALFATIPLAFLVGLLRGRLARSAIADLLVDLRQARRPGDLRDALARALGDPSVQIAYWLADRRRYVDGEGRALELPAGRTDRALLRGFRSAGERGKTRRGFTSPDPRELLEQHRHHRDH